MPYSEQTCIYRYAYISDKAKLLYTDTNSLTYEIETEDVYADFWKDKDKFDNSDYPKKLIKSPFFNETNKKVIGKFKDEAEGVIFRESIGLRSKMYSYLTDLDKCDKKPRE